MIGGGPTLAVADARAEGFAASSLAGAATAARKVMDMAAILFLR